MVRSLFSLLHSFEMNILKCSFVTRVKNVYVYISLVDINEKMKVYILDFGSISL